MRKVVEVLRLKFECKLGERAIAASVGGIGHTTVGEYLRRAKAAGIAWPLPADVDEAELERRLFPQPQRLSKAAARTPPDFALMFRELRRPNVTLSLLWTEYKAEHPDGYQFSQYCELYHRWAGQLRLSMRQHHRAGEKLFVDFSGGTVDVIDPESGEVRAAKLFVAVLGASSFTYLEAVFSEDLPTWLECHMHAFEFFGGVAEVLVPDNLRSGVSGPCRYEPEVNPSYLDLAAHYGTCVIPARVRKPKDKAKAEVGVQVAQRWVLAALRHREFYSLADANDAITPLLAKINDRPMKPVQRSRRQLFLEVEKAALKPLPARRYEIAQWKKARVHPDYHVQFEEHFYSVPHQHRGDEVLVRATVRVVEILLKGRRVASHTRSAARWGYTTVKEHMPPAHQAQADQTVPRVLAWADAIGPHAAALVRQVMERKAHPEQGVKACMGILGLAKGVGRERLEKACGRALRFKTLTYRSVQSILHNHLEDADPAEPRQAALPTHENIRGSHYFH